MVVYYYVLNNSHEQLVYGRKNNVYCPDKHLHHTFSKILKQILSRKSDVKVFCYQHKTGAHFKSNIILIQMVCNP